MFSHLIDFVLKSAKLSKILTSLQLVVLNPERAMKLTEQGLFLNQLIKILIFLFILSFYFNIGSIKILITKIRFFVIQSKVI